MERWRLWLMKSQRAQRKQKDAKCALTQPKIAANQRLRIRPTPSLRDVHEASRTLDQSQATSRVASLVAFPFSRRLILSSLLPPAIIDSSSSASIVSVIQPGSHPIRPTQPELRPLSCSTFRSPISIPSSDNLPLPLQDPHDRRETGAIVSQYKNYHHPVH